VTIQKLAQENLPEELQVHLDTVHTLEKMLSQDKRLSHLPMTIQIQ
jgi:hypothetical protein